MKLDELLTSVKDTLSVQHVYGEPYERDGVTIIPAASIAGGGGGGGGYDGEGQSGEGGGFGVTAKPTGVYVLAQGTVRWHPAIDLNRLAASLVGLVAIVALARVRLANLRTRRRTTR